MGRGLEFRGARREDEKMGEVEVGALHHISMTESEESVSVASAAGGTKLRLEGPLWPPQRSSPYQRPELGTTWCPCKGIFHSHWEARVEREAALGLVLPR